MASRHLRSCYLFKSLCLPQPPSSKIKCRGSWGCLSRCPSEGKDRAKSGRGRGADWETAGRDDEQQDDPGDESSGRHPLPRPEAESRPGLCEAAQLWLRGRCGSVPPLRPAQTPRALTPVRVYPSCLPLQPLLSGPSSPALPCHCAWPGGISLRAGFSLLETP